MMARVWLHPYGVERDYTSALVKATRQFNREINSTYGDIRFDGWQDDMAAILPYLRNAGNRIFQPVIERLPSFFSLTSQFNDKQWRLIVKGGTGVDLPPSQAVIAGQTTIPVSSGVLGVDAYRAEAWLREMQELWVAENVRLIKSIPADELSDMEGIIQRGVMNGSSADTIKKQIQERYGVTERRAKLIAVDQIGKANAALTKQRQADAGISGYKWRGVLDERERPEHRAREGKSYKWNNPPPDGHPGQPIRCRCYAEPDWAGSVFDIGE
ncbi:TPA: minor capsid protein [Enterobacter hormaechei]|uniref:phage head morphogenesis protein n=1 Tax=Enterobacter TaxID=547 RepID=UPI0007C67885|nr:MULTISPECIES: phage minor head protein [Enterobacter]QPX98374.1 minor capsid protein [Enterobacter sp. YSU]HAS0773867.1 phage head morphogenesis protein [Enterobacter hormaechei]HAS1301931.1 phage head morphogenesis protein [Enterobacter hormaechei]HAS1321565.1 phage head morphogenesis protein [Enterobacter hormaechei]HAS1351574.1 phage head morphogenesis protein [Enterobacter hormaechei]